MTEPDEHDDPEAGTEEAAEVAEQAREDQDTEESEAAETAAHEAAEAKAPQFTTEKQLRDLEKKIGRARDAHAKRLGDLLGDAATDTLPCPLCFDGLMGFVLPMDAENLSQDAREAALAFLGAPGATPLREAEGVVMCERCDGWGELVYPSRKPAMVNQPCPACNGNGYRLAPTAPGNVVTFTQLPPTEGGAGVTFGQPCSRCGAPNSEGKPHFCNPTAAVGG